MATIKFYLDKRTKKSPAKYRIFLIFRYRNKRFSYYTPVSIFPDDWNNESERARKTCSEAKHINTILDVLENRLIEIKNNLELNAVLNGKALPKIEDIQKAFFASVRPKESKAPTKDKKSTKSKTPKKLLLHHLFHEFVKEKSATYHEGTLRVFRRCRKNLLNFAEKSGMSLEANSIDLNFQRQYVNYLVEELEYSNSTIGVEIRKIHAVLNHYSERHENRAYNKFKVPKYQAKRFICTHKEVLALYDYSPKEETLLRVRDCVVFSFFTGLAFSDLCNLRTSNLMEDNLNGEKITIIDFKRQKTKKYNQIPLNTICLEIIERWKGKFYTLLPAYQNDQTMNKYLHQLLKDSGLFDREVQTVKESGKRRIETYLPRWKAITFHSFRHGYASYLASQDVNPLTIQKLMGHSDMKTTMIYIHQNRKQVFAEALDKLEK